MDSILEHFGARLRNYMSRRFPSAGQVPHAAANPESDAEFNGMALALFTLQFRNNMAFRKLCEARKLSPATVRHWTEIPAVPASAFKELELSCLSASERSIVFLSSGTTEHRPSRHFHSRQSFEVYEDSLLAWFTPHLISARRSVDGFLPRVGMALTPGPSEAPHSSLVHMFETIHRRFVFDRFVFAGMPATGGGWELNCPSAVETLEKAIESNQAVLLLGTAFSYVHLLDYLAAQNLTLNLPAGSRVLETGGYKGRSRGVPKTELHRLIVSRLGVPSSQIVGEYGMSELSSQAYDWVASAAHGNYTPAHGSSTNPARRFRFPPWARARIVSPETGEQVPEGEAGLIRVIDLANVYSVMAIQTEDVALAQGDGFDLVGRAASAEARGCSLLLR